MTDTEASHENFRDFFRRTPDVGPTLKYPRAHHGGMQLTAAIERLERVVSTRSDRDAVCDDLTAALRASKELSSFLAAADADLAARLAAASSFPEAVIAEVTRESLGSASKTIERGRTLDAAPGLAAAFDEAAVTPGHVDAVTRGAKELEPEQRQELFDRVDELVDVAAGATVAQFSQRIRTEVSRIIRDGGESRLERQRRATSMSTWTDDDGMWNMRGRFDPVTALSLSSALERAIETLFAEAVPDTCPSDPVEKQKHLRALAFARMVKGTAGGGRPGRPEFVGVIDLGGGPVGAGHADDGPQVTWSIPVEVPVRVLAELIGEADVHPVVVRNGAVLHAPGNLNLGRTGRVANRAQRRALRGFYSTCAVPGCSVSYDRCKLHHIVWWRHGGRTDLDNLLPVCVHHHHKIHDNGWDITLGPNRELAITLPDGTIRNTGPPRRNAA